MKEEEIARLAAGIESIWRGFRVTGLSEMPDSHSGFLFAVKAESADAEVDAVLRTPPPSARPIGPADVARQARIMSALRAAGIPTPHILVSSEDAALDGRPFILMEKMRGMRVGDAIEDTSARTLVASAFAAIRAVHAVEPDRSGIGDEPVTDLEAEVARWQRLASRGPADLVRDIGRLHSELLRTRPAERVPVLVHGDYHLGNVLFESGRVVGILDWEIAELGQSPLDEAALCMVAIREAFKEPNPGREAALPLQEMVELAGGGPDFDWYLAATCHKYAAIFGYNLDLHRRGRRHDPLYEQLTHTIPGLVDAGLALLA